MRTRFVRRSRNRSAYTLVEILISVTITLTLLAFMMQAFIFASNQIRNGRAVIEMANELRHCSESMRVDLRHATPQMLPWSSFGSDEGYFFYKEGPLLDNAPLGGGGASSVWGDVDDVIQFTARNLESPYRGIYNGVVIESKVAEICWWTTYDAGTLDAKVYRRELLVAPWLNEASAGPGIVVPQSIINPSNTMTLQEFQQHFDISVRSGGVDGSGNEILIANTLADLSRRQNRFGFYSTRGDFNAADPYLIGDTSLGILPCTLTGSRAGEDVVLASVLAFDVRIFDPTVEVTSSADAAPVNVPGDTSYGTGTTVGFGAFCDIGHGLAGSFGSGAGRPITTSNFYDTWTSYYESNGIDEDGVNGIDQGTDGIDNDGVNGADDEAERETAPPYTTLLRGVQIRFRMREKGTQQVRQVTVEHSFVPE